MKLRKVTGCICDSLTVDGIEEIDMTDEQKIKVIEKICEWMKKNPDQLNYIMQDFIETFADDYEASPEPCECCGDTVYTWTWEI